MNYAKTSLLLAAMTGLFLAIGYMIGGEIGMIFAFVLALGMNVFAYWNADKMVLRMHGAREVDLQSAPGFFNLVNRLAQNANLPMPKVYVIDTDQPNAFVTGRNPENAAVAATRGLMNGLSEQELAGVMAHELAHVKNRDTLTMTITATFAGAISMLANFALFSGGRRDNGLGIIGALALMILAPLAAGIVKMAISRAREYEADRIGAEICGQPLWLASALEKIQRGASAIDNVAAERNPATAHLFIINPLHGQKMDGLFSTHPNTANRVARLREMAGAMTQAGGTSASGPSATGPWG